MIGWYAGHARERPIGSLHAKKRGGALASAAPELQEAIRCRYGSTSSGRIISLSSWSTMWQCHTYGPAVTGSQ